MQRFNAVLSMVCSYPRCVEEGCLYCCKMQSPTLLLMRRDFDPRLLPAQGSSAVLVQRFNAVLSMVCSYPRCVEEGCLYCCKMQSPTHLLMRRDFDPRLLPAQGSSAVLVQRFNAVLSMVCSYPRCVEEGCLYCCKMQSPTHLLKRRDSLHRLLPAQGSSAVLVQRFNAVLSMVCSYPRCVEEGCLYCCKMQSPTHLLMRRDFDPRLLPAQGSSAVLVQRFNAVLSMVCSYPRCVEEGCLYCCKMQSPTHLLMRRDFDPRLLPAQGSSAVLVQRFNAVLSMVCSYPRCVEEGCLYCCKMQSPTHLLKRRDFDPRLLPAQGSSAVLVQRFNAVLSMVCSYPRCVEEGCLYCCKMQSPTHLLKRRDFDPRLLPAQGSSAVLVQRFNAVLSMVCSYPRCVEEGCLYCCKMHSPTHLLMRRDFDPRLLPAQGSSAVLVQRFNAVLSMVCSYPRCVEEGCLYCCEMQSPTHLLN